MINHTQTPILHNVFSVSSTGEENVLCLDVEITDMNAERYRCDYVSRPGDLYGLNPFIQQWLIDNEGSYVIKQYMPPTSEEIRASMLSLNRVAFRTAFKNSGMNTAVINSAIAAIENEDERENMQIIWEDALSFLRLDPFVLMVAAYAGKTPEQVDTLWNEALTV
jgi:hypothetical protein